MNRKKGGVLKVKVRVTYTEEYKRESKSGWTLGAFMD